MANKTGGGINCYCVYCGQELEAGDTFCCGCGRKVDSNTEKDLSEIEGNEIKEKSTEQNDEKDVLSPQSIIELERAFGSANDDQEKISFINAFTIPRQEDELMQLVSLCAENIASVGTTGKNSYEVECAWMGKLEQIYQRVRLTMGTSPIMQNTDAVYREKKQDIIRKNSAGRKLASFVKRHEDGVMIGAFLGFIFLLCLILGLSELVKNIKYNNEIDRIDKLITKEKLDEAYEATQRLNPSSEEQIKSKQRLVSRLSEKQGSIDGKILLPVFSEGVDVNDAIVKLKQAGFTDVTAEVASDREGFEKYAQKMEKLVGIIKQGSIIEISVNGDREYLDQMNHEDAVTVMGTYVNANAKIVLRYYQQK